MARLVVARKEQIRVLNCVIDGLCGELVGISAQHTKAGINGIVNVVERHLRRGRVRCGRGHRVFSAPLVMRVERARAGLVPHSTEVFAHKPVLNAGVVLELLRPERIGRKPNVPRPHDIAAGVLDEQNGITVSGGHAANGELNVLAVAALDERNAGDDACAGLPKEACGCGLTISVFLDIRRGDYVTEMVNEIGRVSRTLSGVSRLVRHAALDTVSVHKGDFIDSGCAHNVAVGGFAENERGPVHGEHGKVLCDRDELFSVKADSVAGGLVMEQDGLTCDERGVGIDRQIGNWGFCCCHRLFKI